MGYSAYQLYYFSDLCPGLEVQCERGAVDGQVDMSLSHLVAVKGQ